MNNILSDSMIERINNYDLKALKTLFDEVRQDEVFAKRRNQRLGVNNRLKLIPASQHKPFGRDADGVPVYCRPDSKALTSDNELNVKTHKDYPNIICSSKTGYMSGIEISSENITAKSKIDEFYKINALDATHNDLVGSCCGYGLKALRLYSNEDRTISFSVLEPWTYAPLYNKTGKLVGLFQWEETTEKIRNTYAVGSYRVSYLNAKEDMYFFTDSLDSVLTPNTQDYPSVVVSGQELKGTEGRRPHLFNGVPVVEFRNNSDSLGDVEKTLDSQDAWDELVSKANTAYSAFADVILNDRTKDEDGLTELDKEEFDLMVRKLQDYGLIEGDWQWLIKDYQGYEQLKNHLSLLERTIYEGSSSYDPNSIGDTSTGTTAYQIRQKLKPLIDSSVKTEMEFKKSYMELFRLILTYGLENRLNKDYLDLNITFQHTVPEDEIATLKQLKEAGVPVPTQLAYQKAGYNWESVKEMLEEEEENTLNQLKVEDVESVR